VSTTLPVRPSLLAEMVVVPGAIASTLPAADICATLTSLLLQFTARLLSVAPAASRSNAVYPDAAPGVNVVTPVTTTDATGIGITVIAAEPDFPSLVAVIVAEKPGEPVNPFTVRTVPPEAMREVSVHVGGIVAGPAACAVVNDRLVQAGETIESLAVERIEPDAVLLRHSGRLLRLPVTEQPTRVRLPL
jgi:hypothetical protein